MCVHTHMLTYMFTHARTHTPHRKLFGLKSSSLGASEETPARGCPHPSTDPVAGRPARRAAAREPVLQTGPCALAVRAAEPQTCLRTRAHTAAQVTSDPPTRGLGPPRVPKMQVRPGLGWAGLLGSSNFEVRPRTQKSLCSAPSTL